MSTNYRKNLESDIAYLKKKLYISPIILFQLVNLYTNTKKGSL